MIQKKLRIVLVFLVLTIGTVHSKSLESAEKFDKTLFYKAMASDSITLLDSQLKLVTTSQNDKKEAYEGALLMKKAGLVSNLREKLKLFKSGRLKLESSISKSTSSAELHFLRLIIQEHAPKIVNYRSDLENDNHIVEAEYLRLDKEVQKAILDYKKKSKYLSNIK